MAKWAKRIGKAIAVVVISVGLALPSFAACDSARDEIRYHNQINWKQEDYKSYAAPRVAPPKYGKRRVIQMEIEDYARSPGLHGRSAAEIVDTLADEWSGKNVRTHMLNMQPFVMSKDLEDVMECLDVMGLSMELSRRFKYDKKTGKINETISAVPYNLERADRMWRSSEAIIVQAAGNSGRPEDTSFKRGRGFSYLNRADTILQVGVAHNGQVLDYSNNAQPSFVSENLFLQGFKYKYVDSEEVFEQKLKSKLFSSIRTTVLVILTNQFLGIGAEDKAAALRGEPRAVAAELQAASNFEDQAVYEVELIKMSQQKKMFELREMVDAMWPNLFRMHLAEFRFLKAQIGVDEEGYATNMHGTSFSAPTAAGIIAGMMEKYPDLNEYEFVAAALASSRPIETAQGASKPLKYKDNGRGLMYNDSRGGFGLFTAKNYEKALKHLMNLRTARPDLSSKTARATVDMKQVKSDDDKIQRIEFDVPDSITSLRMMIGVSGEGSVGPGAMKITKPDGTQIDVPPDIGMLVGEDGQPELGKDGKPKSFVHLTTDQILGNDGKGKWVIEFPAGFKVDKGQMQIVGFEKGGRMDRFLDEMTGVKPETKMQRRRTTRHPRLRMM